MALKISLKPGEKFVVNGAVITNGDRRCNMIIQNKVSILRERDILTAEKIDTPAKRVYFPVMLAYLDPEKMSTYYPEFVQRMSDFMGAIENPEIKLVCVQASMEMMKQDYYKALSSCRKLLDYEAKLLGLNDVTGSVSASSDDL